MLTREEIVALYRRRASRYDLTANLYYLVGFRENAYRSEAVHALRLARGATVVELCCGTGLNFPRLQRATGLVGRIIGVDFSEPMLEQARRRVERNGWRNVDLVHADVGSFQVPAGVSGVLSTFAITLVPEYDRLIAGAAAALLPGKRISILDFRKPERAPRALIKIAVWLTRGFAVSEDLAARHPWESVARHFEDVTFHRRYLGLAYVVSGAAPPRT